MKEYKIKEVTDILGINKSRVQYYYDTGVIVPERDSKGPGTNRYFSLRNIAEIYLAMTLTKLGIGIRTNAGIVQILKDLEADVTKEYHKSGMDKNLSFSAIEPGIFYSDDTIYLSVAFKSEDDPIPNVAINFLPSVEEDAIVDLSFHNFDKYQESSHVLWVNLSRIKMILGNKIP